MSTEEEGRRWGVGSARGSQSDGEEGGRGRGAGYYSDGERTGGRTRMMSMVAEENQDPDLQLDIVNHTARDDDEDLDMLSE